MEMWLILLPSPACSTAATKVTSSDDDDGDASLGGQAIRGQARGVGNALRGEKGNDLRKKI